MTNLSNGAVLTTSCQGLSIKYSQFFHCNHMHHSFMHQLFYGGKQYGFIVSSECISKVGISATATKVIALSLVRPGFAQTPPGYTRDNAHIMMRLTTPITGHKRTRKDKTDSNHHISFLFFACHICSKYCVSCHQQLPHAVDMSNITWASYIDDCSTCHPDALHDDKLALHQRKLTNKKAVYLRLCGSGVQSVIQQEVTLAWHLVTWNALSLQQEPRHLRKVLQHVA